MSTESFWTWGVGLRNDNELLFTFRDLVHGEQELTLHISNDKKALLYKTIKFEETIKGTYYTTTSYEETVKELLKLDINIPIYFMIKYKQ